MPDNEKPAYAGLSEDAEDFALLLMHRCTVFERASGDYDETSGGIPMWGAHMRCMFTCTVCGASRPVMLWNDFVDWLAIKKKRGRDGTGSPHQG